MTLPGLGKFKTWLAGNVDADATNTVMYDRTLVWMVLGLIVTGFVMVTSASIPAGDFLVKDPFFFARRDAIYLSLCFLLSLITLRIPMDVWLRYSNFMLLGTIILLVAVLFVGSSVNGASRWVAIGPLRIQPAELSKLSFFCYLSSYLVRKVEEVRNNFWGFCKPMGVMIALAILLLAQPDLGTVVVLFVTTLTLLFLAGAKLWQFLAIISSGLFSVCVLIVTEPYRMRRVTSFLDPWKDAFGDGYQLTNSLMAFGRGTLFGQGLGHSVQKLEYLPESHTDFIFAIIAEELGYFGVVLVLAMVFFVAFRAMMIGRRALQLNQRFSGFLACAIGIWFSFQTFINVGAAAGILPTKGLTLPLVSYGGSSLIVMSTAVVLLLRIDYEIRLANAQAFVRSPK